MLRNSFKRVLRRSLCSSSDFVVKPSQQVNTEPSDAPDECRKVVRVAILGLPNVGKSTLINRLVGRVVCAASSKVHTTRRKTVAAITEGDTQIVFLDTPGLVTKSHCKKHNLEKSLLTDGITATCNANVVGVIHDASNKYSTLSLTQHIIKILETIPTGKPVFLVLNKVDLVKNKTKLLQMIDVLTERKVSNKNEVEFEEQVQVDANDNELLDENNVVDDSNKGKNKVKCKRRAGWDRFSQVFMISALEGEGTNEILNYLHSFAKVGRWQLPEDKVTNLPPDKLIEQLVRAQMLNALDKEIGYMLDIAVEYLHQNEIGDYVCVVLIGCIRSRYALMLIRHKQKLRDISQAAEADACSALQANVRLRLIVESYPKKKHHR